MQYYMALHPALIYYMTYYILPSTITCSITSCLKLLHDILHPSLIYYMTYYILTSTITCSITSCLDLLHDLLHAALHPLHVSRNLLHDPFRVNYMIHSYPIT